MPTSCCAPATRSTFADANVPWRFRAYQTALPPRLQASAARGHPRQHLRLSGFQPHLRPGPGTLGRRMSVCSEITFKVLLGRRSHHARRRRPGGADAPRAVEVSSRNELGGYALTLIRADPHRTQAALGRSPTSAGQAARSATTIRFSAAVNLDMAMPGPRTPSSARRSSASPRDSRSRASRMPRRCMRRQR